MKIPLKISLEDLVQVARRKDVTIATTPFGAEPGEVQYILKKAVPWKGIKGIDNVRKINSAVAAGLEKAIRISKSHTEPGKAVLIYPDGSRVVVPAKCAYMAYEAHKDYGVKIGATLPAKRPWRRKRVAAPAVPS